MATDIGWTEGVRSDLVDRRGQTLMTVALRGQILGKGSDPIRRLFSYQELSGVPISKSPHKLGVSMASPGTSAVRPVALLCQ